MKQIFIISLLLILFAGNASAWYSNDWNQRIPVTIDNTGNVSLINYLFDVSIPSGINESSIRVVDDTSNTVVPHWSENVSGGVCYGLWFNASVGSEINTDFYIYYNNNAVASTSSYNDTFGEGIVLDMPLTTRYADGNTMIDRSPYANNGTNYGATVGSDYTSFDGVNDYVNCGNDTSFDITEKITVGARINLKTNTGWRRIISKQYDGSSTANSCYQLGVHATNLFRWSIGGSCDKYMYTPQIDTWYYIVGTYDKTHSNLYVDGTKVFSYININSIRANSFSNLSIGTQLFLNVAEYFTNGSIADIYIYNRSLTPTQITSLYEQHNTTPSVTLESVQVPYINISLHSKSPETLFTNYTGFLSASYIVESNAALNMSSMAFLMGMNYTLTSDYHSYLKVPCNSIADDGIYRAHNRNTTPYLSWEGNDTITEGNVWKWSGGQYGDHWIKNTTINSTHTWVNVTGVASNVFSSSFYLGRSAMYASEKTGIEINKGQGVIIKVWDLEQFRGRNNDYWVNLFFDTQIESTPDCNIDIWYCNGSFDPNTDDPTSCVHCAMMDTWNPDRWMDHQSYQPHTNVSYSKPLHAFAGEPSDIPPSTIDYVYFESNTPSSKSYILNATNCDPGICNLTFAQTNSMWVRNEIAGTNTPHAYTPSFFITFVRDYLEFTHHLYLANDQGVWGHSDYCTHPIGISNMNPTHTRFNYFWRNGTTDYCMNGSYTEDFWINLTYGIDPDNGASLTHVLSLYDDDYNFITFVNTSLIGNATSENVYFNLTEHISIYHADNYRFKIVATDNEGSTSVSWSNQFSIPRESKYKSVVIVIKAFPATLQHTLTTLLSYIPLLIGGLIAGVLIILVMSIFGKLKRW